MRPQQLPHLDAGFHSLLSLLSATTTFPFAIAAALFWSSFTKLVVGFRIRASGIDWIYDLFTHPEKISSPLLSIITKENLPFGSFSFTAASHPPMIASFSAADISASGMGSAAT